MAAYWITFEGHRASCIEATSSAQAIANAALITGCKVISHDILPYPAEPRIGEKSSCPSFCYHPETCKGHTACPRNYSCTE